MNTEQRMILASLEGWDTIVIEGIALSCIYDRDYVEILDVAGTFPNARVATHQVQGDQPLVSVAVNTRVEQVLTHDGREEGPFTVKVIQPDDPGTLLLILEDIPGGG